MSKRGDQERQIAEHLGAVFYLICNSCKSHKKLMAMDADEAACGFYEDGWRLRGEKVICRQCLRLERK